MYLMPKYFIFGLIFILSHTLHVEISSLQFYLVLARSFVTDVCRLIGLRLLVQYFLQLDKILLAINKREKSFDADALMEA